MTSEDVNLRYTESGQGEPLVLLDWTPWQSPSLADALSAIYRVVSIHPPGNARAAATAHDASEGISRVARLVGLSAFTLVGASLGADAAFLVAAQHPDSVSTLVLVSPTCIEAPGPHAWATPGAARRAMLAHPDDPGQATPDTNRTAALSAMAALWQETSDDAASLLSGLTCATLVVFGQEDRLASKQAGGVWKGSVPNCSLCYVYDAGHAVGVDRPEALANIILDFAERRETFIVENRSGLINP